MNLSVPALFLLAALAVPAPAHAVIFGDDNRLEAWQNARGSRYARATAVQVPLTSSELKRDGWAFEMLAASDPNALALCPGERFRDQPVSPVACTGFLVAPDLLITAGHCAVNWSKVEDTVTPQCESFGWLFDFFASPSAPVRTRGISAARFVRCKRVIFANQEVGYDPVTKKSSFGEDIALIELDHPMIDRAVLRLSSAGLADGDHVWTIGYPLGLPAKIAGHASVFDASPKEFYRTDLDVTGGNSGGPVINRRGEVAGVVVRAFPDADFVPDETARCARLNRCDADRRNCSMDSGEYPVGSEVQRIEPILPYLHRALRGRNPGVPPSFEARQR